MGRAKAEKIRVDHGGNGIEAEREIGEKSITS